MRIPEIYLRSSVRSVLLAFGHLGLFSVVYLLAFAMRFDFAIPSETARLYWISLAWVALLKLGVFYLLSHYHGWWRFVTFSDLAALSRASTLAVLLIVAVDHFAIASYQIPRTVVLLDWLLTLIVIGGLRCSYRFLAESCHPWRSLRDCRRVLIIGANEATGRLAQQIQADPRLGYHVVGFLDWAQSKRGLSLSGIPVLGSVEHLLRIAKSYRVKDVLAIDAHVNGKEMRRLMEQCDELHLQLRVIPAFESLLNGHHCAKRYDGAHLHARDVDIADLLRREPVQLDGERIRGLLQGRNVMVTGAGGSIGSEICRQIVRYAPRSLIMVERFENNLFQIDRALRSSASKVPLYPCIADITEESRMRQIFTRHSVDVVFHAAAHKHVPMLELNPGEAIKNNVLGTKCVADLSHRYGVHAFVMISTDKAVNPSSVMGLTKQIAERYVQSLSRRSRTRFVAVRFGNVLGSSGSVVPIFQEQIRNGGPLTITHPEMQRFFMTIPEASQLVLQAAASGQGGEVFVLDMGEPVNIVDLARDLIRLSGARPEEMPIIYTGVRPGEKAFEELYSDSEQLLPSDHPKIWVVEGLPVDLLETKDAITRVSAVLQEPDDVVRRVLQDVVLQSGEAPDECAFGAALLATQQDGTDAMAVGRPQRESLVSPNI